MHYICIFQFISKKYFKDYYYLKKLCFYLELVTKVQYKGILEKRKEKRDSRIYYR